jgi:drug/metabolite transporter (DMT)-like permease
MGGENPTLGYEALRDSPRRVSKAEWMLLIATVVWGASFALAKNVGDQLNAAAGYASTHHFGQMATMGVRFAIASVLWAVIFSRARSGWSWSSCGRGAVLGGLLFLGIALQHSALARIDEGTTAFFTSMAVLFVPVGMWILFRERPTLAFLAAVVVAAPGVYLISSAHASGFGLGESLGMACAVAFAAHLIGVNLIVSKDTPTRMTLAQFMAVAAGCGALAVLWWPRGFDFGVAGSASLWTSMAMMVLGPTLVSFGLMMRYQPEVTPGRAALIYLLEPVFAALFAWWWNDRSITMSMMTGGALILAANAIVEFSPRRRTGVETG